MISRLRFTAVLVLVVTVSVFAQVNFTGAWKLNNDKSVLGEGRGARAALSLTVTHNDKLAVERVSTNRDGDQVTDKESYTLDGKTCKNELTRGEKESQVTFSEDKKTLIISSVIKMSFNGNDMEMKNEEKWSLQDDGKTLKIESKSETPRGEREQTLYYDKQ